VGATVILSGFKVPGSNTLIKPGSGPVPVVDPATGTVTGTVDIRSGGTYTFTPAPGFTGAVPPIMRTVTSSDGQSKEVPLTVYVTPPLRVGDTSVSAVNTGAPVIVNVLTSTAPPPGTSVRVTSFTLPGGSTYPAGSMPVPVTDPLTGKFMGAVTVREDGTAVFTPAPGYSGPVPPITYVV
jgi:hypothetical protein